MTLVYEFILELQAHYFEVHQLLYIWTLYTSTEKIVVPMTPVYCVLSYDQNYIWVNDTADYALVNITVAVMRADHLQDIKVTSFQWKWTELKFVMLVDLILPTNMLVYAHQWQMYTCITCIQVSVPCRCYVHVQWYSVSANRYCSCVQRRGPDARLTMLSPPIPTWDYNLVLTWFLAVSCVAVGAYWSGITADRARCVSHFLVSSTKSVVFGSFWCIQEHNFIRSDSHCV